VKAPTFLLVATVVALAAARQARADETAVTQACIVAYERADEQRKIHRDPLRARELAAQCTRECPATLASECSVWEREEAGKIARLTIDARGEGIVVRVDGEVRPSGLMELRPGEHELSISTPDGARHVERLTLREGEVASRTVSLTDPGVPSTTVVALALGGAGAASLIGAGVLSILGHVRASDLRESCAPACEDEDVASIERRWMIGGILAGVGGALGAAALLTWSLSSEGTASLVVSPGDVQAGLGVRWAF
jgi:hypothetical protein